MADFKQRSVEPLFECHRVWQSTGDAILDAILVFNDFLSISADEYLLNTPLDG